MSSANVKTKKKKKKKKRVLYILLILYKKKIIFLRANSYRRVFFYEWYGCGFKIYTIKTECFKRLLDYAITILYKFYWLILIYARVWFCTIK